MSDQLEAELARASDGHAAVKRPAEHQFRLWFLSVAGLEWGGGDRPAVRRERRRRHPVFGEGSLVAGAFATSSLIAGPLVAEGCVEPVDESDRPAPLLRDPLVNRSLVVPRYERAANRHWLAAPACAR